MFTTVNHTFTALGTTVETACDVVTKSLGIVSYKLDKVAEAEAIKDDAKPELARIAIRLEILAAKRKAAAVKPLSDKEKTSFTAVMAE